MAEEANIKLQQDLAAKEVPDLAPPQRAPAVGERMAISQIAYALSGRLLKPTFTILEPTPACGRESLGIECPVLQGRAFAKRDFIHRTPTIGKYFPPTITDHMWQE